jgi:hypothetical protein
MPQLHKDELRIFGKERQVDELQIPLLHFQISLQDGLHEEHIHWHANI